MIIFYTSQNLRWEGETFLVLSYVQTRTGWEHFSRHSRIGEKWRENHKVNQFIHLKVFRFVHFFRFSFNDVTSPTFRRFPDNEPVKENAEKSKVGLTLGLRAIIWWAKRKTNVTLKQDPLERDKKPTYFLYVCLKNIHD
jgi:hypothetical protein